MRICNCCIFRIFQQGLHIACFSHKLAFMTAILILFVFLLPISIRFRYRDHLVANRMAPSMCPDPSGTRRGSWFQPVLCHISAAIWRLCDPLIFGKNATYCKTGVPNVSHVDAVSAVASSHCSFLCVAVPAVWIPPAVCPVLNRPIGRAVRWACVQSKM